MRLAPNKYNAVLLDCAGVISDLGLPTAPIRPKQEYEAIEVSKSTCSVCESERVYRTIKEDTAYKVCAECGHREEIESQTGYECEECGKIHGNDANFTADHGKLYLVCHDCWHKTIVSEATAHDELKVIFDKRLVETLKRRITATYCTALINKYGVQFIYDDEVKRQIQAINILIEQHPEDTVSGTLERITDRMSTSADSWRLLAKHYEDELLPKQQDGSMIEDVEMTSSCMVPDTKGLKEKFYSSRGFTEAVKTLNALLEANGKAPLKDWVVDKTVQQIKDSNIQGAERMTVKRLNNLYSNGKDCNSIDTFIPYIEEQRKIK